MRILFVISGLGIGGAERQVVLLSRELTRRGHGVSIYTLNRELARVDELDGCEIDLVVDQKRVRLDPCVLWRLRRHVVRWGPSVVHGFLYDGNLYARLAGAGVPVVNSERNDGYRLSFAQSMGYRLTSTRFRGLVANSHAGAAFARRLHRLGERDVGVVWNGIDLAEVDERVSRSSGPARAVWPGEGLKRACIVGAIKPQKDHALALRVARILVDADPSWRFICVGDELSRSSNGHKAKVHALCEDLRLQSHVRFVGHRHDALELMASSDLLLATSLHEGFPNVVLEAMACGTPVATTEYSDVRRILPMAWQVASSRSPQELAEIALRCIREREAVAAAQRRWVEANATVAASADALLAVYAGLRPAMQGGLQ
jgi:glycosyltransferase involved in cell wall biosynthesis